MIGGGPFALAPGQWTDDTAMALALADSLVTCRGFDPDDLALRFLAWWQEGTYSCTGRCFDIGLTTREALARYDETDEPFSGSTDPEAAGNGSLMRLAPVALFTLPDMSQADDVARDQSRITHAAPQAVEACAYFVQLLRGAILGEADVLRPRSWLGPDTEGLRDRLWISDMHDHPTLAAWEGDAAVQAIALGSWRDKTRDQIRSSGYVIHTLEAALWCVGTTASFEAALVRAVNLGEDADTVGAVTGQLAGAFYGASAIPERWLAPLAWKPKIIDFADRLAI